MFCNSFFTAEMGADFNILEYADPELNNITGGDKTNILDLELEQVEVETKEEKQKKESKEDEHKSEDLAGTGRVLGGIGDKCTVSTVQTSTDTTTAVSTQVQAMTSLSATPQAPQQQQSPILPQSHPQAVVVQQQMHQHVQQAAAMGRPIPPGTRILSPDGAVGVVTSTNTVTVSYPSTFPGHPQRVPQTHIQGNILSNFIIIHESIRFLSLVHIS